MRKFNTPAAAASMANKPNNPETVDAQEAKELLGGVIDDAIENGVGKEDDPSSDIEITTRKDNLSQIEIDSLMNDVNNKIGYIDTGRQKLSAILANLCRSTPDMLEILKNDFRQILYCDNEFRRSFDDMFGTSSKITTKLGNWTVAFGDDDIKKAWNSNPELRAIVSMNDKLNVEIYCGGHDPEDMSDWSPLVINDHNINAWGNLVRLLYAFWDNIVNKYTKNASRVDVDVNVMVETIKGDIAIRNCYFDKIPYKLCNTVEGRMYVSNMPRLNTLDNFPDVVSSNIIITGGTCPMLSKSAVAKNEYATMEVSPFGTRNTQALPKNGGIYSDTDYAERGFASKPKTEEDDVDESVKAAVKERLLTARRFAAKQVNEAFPHSSQMTWLAGKKEIERPTIKKYEGEPADAEYLRAIGQEVPEADVDLSGGNKKAIDAANMPHVDMSDDEKDKLAKLYAERDNLTDQFMSVKDDPDQKEKKNVLRDRLSSVRKQINDFVRDLESRRHSELAAGRAYPTNRSTKERMDAEESANRLRLRLREISNELAERLNSITIDDDLIERLGYATGEDTADISDKIENGGLAYYAPYLGIPEIRDLVDERTEIYYRLKNGRRYLSDEDLETLHNLDKQAADVSSVDLDNDTVVKDIMAARKSVLDKISGGTNRGLGKKNDDPVVADLRKKLQPLVKPINKDAIREMTTKLPALWSAIDDEAGDFKITKLSTSSESDYRVWTDAITGRRAVGSDWDVRLLLDDRDKILMILSGDNKPALNVNKAQEDGKGKKDKDGKGRKDTNIRDAFNAGDVWSEKGNSISLVYCDDEIFNEIQNRIFAANIAYQAFEKMFERWYDSNVSTMEPGTKNTYMIGGDGGTEITINPQKGRGGIRGDYGQYARYDIGPKSGSSNHEWDIYCPEYRDPDFYRNIVSDLLFEKSKKVTDYRPFRGANGKPLTAYRREELKGETQKPDPENPKVNKWTAMDAKDYEEMYKADVENALKSDLYTQEEKDQIEAAGQLVYKFNTVWDVLNYLKDSDYPYTSINFIDMYPRPGEKAPNCKLTVPYKNVTQSGTEYHGWKVDMPLVIFTKDGSIINKVVSIGNDRESADRTAAIEDTMYIDRDTTPEGSDYTNMDDIVRNGKVRDYRPSFGSQGFDKKGKEIRQRFGWGAVKNSMRLRLELQEMRDHLISGTILSDKEIAESEDFLRKQRAGVVSSGPATSRISSMCSSILDLSALIIGYDSNDVEILGKKRTSGGLKDDRLSRVRGSGKKSFDNYRGPAHYESLFNSKGEPIGEFAISELDKIDSLMDKVIAEAEAENLNASDKTWKEKEAKATTAVRIRNVVKFGEKLKKDCYTFYDAALTFKKTIIKSTLCVNKEDLTDGPAKPYKQDADGRYRYDKYYEKVYKKDKNGEYVKDENGNYVEDHEVRGYEITAAGKKEALNKAYWAGVLQYENGTKYPPEVNEAMANAAKELEEDYDIIIRKLCNFKDLLKNIKESLSGKDKVFIKRMAQL